MKVASPKFSIIAFGLVAVSSIGFSDDASKPKATRFYDSQMIEELFKTYQERAKKQAAETAPHMDAETLELHSLKPLLVEGNRLRIADSLEREFDPEYRARKWARIRELDPEAYYDHLTTVRNDDEFWLGTYDGGQMDGAYGTAFWNAAQLGEGLKDLKNFFKKMTGGKSSKKEP